jgi:phosphoglycerate kinase
MKTLRDFSLEKKRVLVRCDFNLPLAESGEILDDFRIQKTLPTINYLLEKGAKIILMSHLAKPGGKVVESLRLTNIQQRLMEYLDLSVTKAKDCIGKDIEDWTLKMQEGEILLLENLRFHREEEAGDLNFAQELAKLGDIFINDAFGACHRAHASIVGVPKYLPSGAGFLLAEEIKNLEKLIKLPQKPMISIIGGQKVETKAKLIDRISEISDFLLVGGLIKKEIETKKIHLKNPQKILGPVDSQIQGLDIGPKTVELFKEKIARAKTIFWNGPLGKIEKEQFSKGTKEIAKAICQGQAFSVVGGGETVEFIRQLNLTDKFTHVSTGGGAMLTFLSGEKLPGITVLEDNANLQMKC